MFKYTRNQGGWILIDSLLGMVIITTALCALLAAYSQTTHASVESNTNTYATYLAQRELEKLKQYDGQIAINITPISTVTNGSIQYTINTEEVAVAAVTSTTGLNTFLRPVQVTVNWQEGGQTKHLSMMGYYYIAEP
jgi:nitrogen fixation protein FixH